MKCDRFTSELSSYLIQKVRNLCESQSDPRASPLFESIEYSLLGGKQIRAILSYAAFNLNCGFDNFNDDLIKVASAVEMIHAYSLIHDDLPIMDDDDLRRGKPSCHKKYGEATALLAGDALQSMAFEEISQLDKFPQALESLSHAALQMVVGQYVDCTSQETILTQDQLSRMHLNKTGALICSAAELGWIVSPSFNEAKLTVIREVALKIGLSFQIADDILDATSNSEILGKTAGKDFYQNKNTYVSLLGIDESSRLKSELVSESLRLLEENFDRAASFLEFIKLLELRKF